jgi:hypothetical protein
MLKNMTTNLREFQSHNEYASVKIQEEHDYYMMEAIFSPRILHDVTAVHIHSNVNNAPGPIIAWLLTTSQWQNGVLQQTPGKNSPCCNVSTGSTCRLAAPPGTLTIDSIKPNTSYHFKIPRKYCGFSCPGITKNSPFAFLVIHGTNFQYVTNGCLSAGKPQLDVLLASPLMQVV